MLISCRKVGDSLEIGERMEIRIISIRKSRVTLGLVAPRDMKIVTRKLTEMEMANTMAAAHSVEFDHLLHPSHDGPNNVAFVLDPRLPETNSQSADKDNGGLDE
jgi:carbon storage regulator